MKHTASDLERYLDGDCSPDETLGIEEELKRAPELAQEYHELERLNALVRDRAHQTRAPQALRERIADRFGLDEGAGTAKGRRITNRRGFLIGTGSLLAAGVAAVAVMPGLNGWLYPERDPVETFFRDFETYLLKDRAVDVAETNMVRLAGWFSDRLSFSLPPIGSSGAGAQLVGGRLCWLLERRLASLSYETDDGPIVIYVMNADGIDVPKGRENAELGDRLSWHRSADNTSLMWTSGELLIVMVGTQELRKLMIIAHSLIG